MLGYADNDGVFNTENLFRHIGEKKKFARHLQARIGGGQLDCAFGISNNSARQ